MDFEMVLKLFSFWDINIRLKMYNERGVLVSFSELKAAIAPLHSQKKGL
jgi:hypothetical protein